MTWLDLDSLCQNNQPSYWTFLPINCLFSLTNRLLLFTNQLPNSPSHCHFSGKRFPVTGLAIDCHFIPNDCLCVLADITKRLPRLPSDCLPIQAIARYALSPSDWLMVETNSQVFMGFRHLSTP